MAFFGDPVMPVFWATGGGMLCTPMPTAIVRTYTQSGFVIAADGRKRHHHGTVRSDKQQKIFSIEQTGLVVAYSIAGNPIFTPEDNDDLQVFNLITEIPKAVQTLASTLVTTLPEYGKALADMINERLRQAKETPNTDYPEITTQSHGLDSTIAYLFFDGYCNERPSRLQIRFFHEGQDLKPPEVFPQDLFLGYHIGYGSDIMRYIIFETDDARFSQFRMPKRRPADVTITDAVEEARRFIEACKTPEALTEDPEHCAGIGGHIHIATVTPSRGFRWVKDRAPLAE